MFSVAIRYKMLQSTKVPITKCITKRNIKTLHDTCTYAQRAIFFLNHCCCFDRHYHCVITQVHHGLP